MVSVIKGQSKKSSIRKTTVLTVVLAAAMMLDFVFKAWCKAI